MINEDPDTRHQVVIIHWKGWSKPAFSVYVTKGYDTIKHLIATIQATNIMYARTEGWQHIRKYIVRRHD
jgi:hypothetical protein